MRIAVPSHPFYTPLIGGLQTQATDRGLSIRTGSEEECAKWLRSNLVDLALLSPYGYGQGVLTADYRIVPTTACMLSGWTNTASITFNTNDVDVLSIASAHDTDYIIRCAAIVLDEQYGIDAPVQHDTSAFEEQISKYSAVIEWQNASLQRVGLDVSEEWDMTFAHPLFLSLWVCRSEFVLDGGAENNERDLMLRELTKSCVSADYLPQQEVHETHAIADTEPRVGLIDWTWNDESEEILNQCLQLLFFRQLLPEIPAVKLLGRD